MKLKIGNTYLYKNRAVKLLNSYDSGKVWFSTTGYRYVFEDGKERHLNLNKSEVKLHIKEDYKNQFINQYIYKEKTK